MRDTRRTRSARAAGQTRLQRRCGRVGVAMAEASGEVAAVPASGAASGLSNGAGGPPPQTSNPLSRKLHKILETRLDNDKVTGAAPGAASVRHPALHPSPPRRRGPRTAGRARGRGGRFKMVPGRLGPEAHGGDPVPRRRSGSERARGAESAGQDEARRREPVATHGLGGRERVQASLGTSTDRRK